MSEPRSVFVRTDIGCELNSQYVRSCRFCKKPVLMGRHLITHKWRSYDPNTGRNHNCTNYART